MDTTLTIRIDKELERLLEESSKRSDQSGVKASITYQIFSAVAKKAFAL